jgi:cytochrome c-type biogenesis protein CcsB
MSINILLFNVTLLLYLVATILFLVEVSSRHIKTAGIARWILWGGFVSHCAALLFRFIEVGHTPVASLYESLSFFAWALVGAFIVFDLRYRLAVLGAFVCPLAVVLMLVGSAVIIGGVEPQQPNPVLQSKWFPVHVTFAFLGYAVFGIAFAAGIMYLLQERMLKSKRFSALYYKLPALDTLDSINYKCLSFGFPLMTLGIISGAVWANSAWGGYWRWDPKETWALITWFWYAALLHGRLSIGWRGRRAAIFAIIGFVALVFSFLGVNLLLDGAHTFKSMRGE